MLTAVNTNFHDSSSFPFLMPDEITNKIWNGSEISSVFLRPVNYKGFVKND